MPKYRVTLSDGRVVRLEADQQPNEADVLMAIGEQTKKEPTIGANLHQEAKIGADPRPGGADFSVFGVPIHVPGRDRPRADENLMDVGGVGVPPEAVLMGPVQAGRAMLDPALSMAGKMTAGASTLLGHAAPVVKYEAARHALKAVGIPDSLAIAGAIAISGYKRGGGAKAAEAETVAAPTPAPAAADVAPAVESIPKGWGQPKPTVKPEEMGQWLALKAQGKSAADATDAIVAQRGTPVAAEVVASKPAAPSVSWFDKARAAFAEAGETPQPGDISNTADLLRRGRTPDDALGVVLGKRPKAALSPAEELAKRLGTPSEAERQATQDLLYRQGKRKTPSAETARAERNR